MTALQNYLQNLCNRGVKLNSFKWNGFKYVSFDVESLFRNVPIKWTIDVIPTRIYQSTNLKKNSRRKRILDTCTKTAFSFNNIIYEQKDGVSIGSSLGPLCSILS